MTYIRNQRIALMVLAITIALAMFIIPISNTNASDHADAPINASDQGIDQGDTYAFLDPNDNKFVVLILTVRGFIAAGENTNFGFFDPNVRYRFNIETTGDARPDQTLDVTFTPRTGPTTPQTATVVLPFGETFTAPTTPASLAATPPSFVVTTDPGTGVSFFAGITDDPFFFDIPGFSRFRASVLAGNVDATQLQRGRDSFAGYNIMSIALRIPTTYFRLVTTSNNPGGNVIGVDSVTQRPRRTVIGKDGSINLTGGFQTLDRSGNPGLNALVIPFLRKDEYNFATTFDDAQGRFAGDIVATLKALGTNDTNIGILASVYVAKGDSLRLNVSIPNTGTGSGTTAGAGFPNGRRLADDVVDTFLFFVTNQALTTGDNVNVNDVAFTNTFPFLAPPQQPRASGTTDDNTRN
ncbi:MAG: DUF4331 family protein [Acidobacteriota bacterium]